jgi:hypothetical protein
MEVSRDRLRLKDLQSHPRGTESSTALVQCPSPPMKALSSMVSPSANEPSQEKTKTQDVGNACMDFASLYDFDLIYCVALQPEAQAQARSLKSIEFLPNTPRTDQQPSEPRMHSTEWSIFQMASKTHGRKKKIPEKSKHFANLRLGYGEDSSTRTVRFWSADGKQALKEMLLHQAALWGRKEGCVSARQLLRRRHPPVVRGLLLKPTARRS